MSGIHFLRGATGLKTAVVHGKRNRVQQWNIFGIKWNVEENVPGEIVDRATAHLLRSHGNQPFFLMTFRTAWRILDLGTIVLARGINTTRPVSSGRYLFSATLAADADFCMILFRQ